MRKIICILLLTALLLSTLVACNVPDNVDNAPSADTTADDTTTAPIDTTPYDTSPAFDESLYELCGGFQQK